MAVLASPPMFPTPQNDIVAVELKAGIRDNPFWRLLKEIIMENISNNALLAHALKSRLNKSRGSKV
jgi:hypothetical protein